MKGISLSIETVIILILAVIVLGSLLVFYFNAFNTENIEKTGRQTEMCQQYVRIDPACKNPGELITFLPGGQASLFLKEIVPLCRELGFAKSCGTGAETFGTASPCIQECCANFCSP